jgi:hypothetical protein
MKENEKEPAFPALLYGLPTYENSRLVSYMSSLDGDPYIAVFLSTDPYQKILDYYKSKLKVNVKELKYGRGKRIMKTIYQLEVEKGVLPDYIGKGVEISALNGRSQRVYKAKTKIRLIVPRKEVLEAKAKKDKRPSDN